MIRVIIYYLFLIITDIINLILIIGLCYIIYKSIIHAKNDVNKAKARKRRNPIYSSPKQSGSDNIYTEYYHSAYYLSTHLPLDAVMHDKGRYGEYMIFKDLQIYEKSGSRFLFNCYIPKKDNQTTEIDVILLTTNGIFVFESKNYRGWVYGMEKQELWTLTIPAGNKIQKEHFYNPITQNSIHVKALKNLIEYDIPIYSVIVFSNSCKLKNIRASDPMTEIVSFGYLKPIITYLSSQRPNSITQEMIISIYNKLYPFTQVPEEVKRKHAEDVQAKKTRI